MIKEGEKVPYNIKLQSTKGGEVSLKDFEGKYLVIYFYPKDDTPGCTTQACELRDNFEAIKEYGAEVVGVSKDDIRSHHKFIDKNNLPFALLSDPEIKLHKIFGAWGEKSMYGKKYMGTIRSAFIIDPNGVLVKAFPNISPKKTVPHILQFFKSKQTT